MSQGGFEMDATFSLTLVFFAFILFIGVFAGQDINDFKSFVLSRGYFGRFALVATITATFIGGGMIVGNAERSYQYGLGFMFAILGACLQFVFAAKILNPKIIEYKSAITIGDFTQRWYGDASKIIIGSAWVLFCIGLVTTQFLALGKIFAAFLGLDLSIAILAGASVVTFYCYYGGIRSVIMTDIAHFIFMLLAIPMLCYIGISKHPSLHDFLSAIPKSHLQLFGTLSPLQFTLLFVTFFLGEALFPPYVQRVLISDQSKISTTITYWSALLASFLCICGTLIGLIAVSLDRSLEQVSVLNFLFQNASNPLIQSITIIGLSSVIMSSVDSNLNSVAASFVYDILQPLRGLKRKKLKDEDFLSLARLLTLLIGFTSALIAIFLEKLPIISILLLAYKFWAPIVLIPLGATILGFRTTKPGFFASISGGVIAVIVWESLNLEALLGFDSFIPGVVSNFLVYLSFYKVKGPHGKSTRYSAQ